MIQLNLTTITIELSRMGLLMKTYPIQIDFYKISGTINGSLIHYYLVGGLEDEFSFFHSVGNVIIPTDFHIFQRGRYTSIPPTRL